MANEFQNVHQSVIVHAETNLEAISGVMYPGVDLKTEGLTEWIEVFVQGPVSRPSRGREEEYLVTINCFARVGFTAGGAQQENAYRHLQMADLVAAQFSAFDLDVLDYADAQQSITRLRFEEADVVVLNNIDDTNLQQAAVSVGGLLVT